MRSKTGNPTPNATPNLSDKNLGERSSSDYVDTRLLTEEARERFILDYMGFVKLKARKLAKKLPSSISIDDLVSEGVLALMDAMSRYDPNQKVLFSTFAEIRIEGAMIDFLRKGNPLQRVRSDNYNKIEAILIENEKRIKIGLSPLTDEEMAKKLGMKIQYFYDLLGFAKSDVSIHEQFDEHRTDYSNNNLSESQDILARRKEVADIIKSAFEEFLLSVNPKKRERLRSLYEKHYVLERTRTDIRNDSDFSVNATRMSQLLMDIKKGVEQVLRRKGFKPEDFDLQ